MNRLAFLFACLVLGVVAAAWGSDHKVRNADTRDQDNNANNVVQLYHDNGDTTFSPYVVLSSGSAIGGYTAVVGGSFTRPADTTAYAAGDLVANSVTAGSVTPISVAAARVNAGTGMIRRIRLTTSSPSTTNASFRVHFYKTSPTFTNGDNAAWLTTGSTYLGACDVTIDKVFSDGAKGIGVPNTGTEINFDTGASTQNIFAVIEARGAYTPTSGETFTLAVEVLQN